MEERRKFYHLFYPETLAQKRYLQLIFWLIVLYTVVLMITFCFTTIVIFRLAELGPRAERIFLHQILPVLILSLFAEGAIAILVGWLISLIISHRIVGPILRIIRYLKDIASGKEQEIKIRSSDDVCIKMLTEAINEVLSKKS